MSINQYDYIVFDCDGVLIDSNYLKQKVFMDSLSGYPEDKIALFKAFNEKNGGVNRKDKIEHFLKVIMDRGDESQVSSEKESILKRIDELMELELRAVKLTEGIEALLKFLKEKNKNLHVVSAGPDNEVKHILRNLKIDQFFLSIRGGPTDKIENCRRLSLEYPLSGKKGLFVGDSSKDYECAKYLGVDFIFLRKYSAEKNTFDLSGDLFSVMETPLDILRDFKQQELNEA